MWPRSLRGIRSPLRATHTDMQPLCKGTEFTPERSTITVTHELLTIGRISVDIYPNDIGVDLEDVTSFGKYLGGSPSNVAVAAARHGRRTAVITRTGDDAFGKYLHRELRKFNVDDSFVTAVKEWPTAVTFCAIKPPEDFPLYFYGRFPTAPDLQIKAGELDLGAIRDAGIFWSTVTGLCQEPSRDRPPRRPRGPAPDRAEAGPVHHPGPRLPADVLGFRGGSPGAGRQDPPARHRRDRQRQGMCRRRRRRHPGRAGGPAAGRRRRNRRREAWPRRRDGQDPHRACGVRPGPGGNRQRPRRRRLLRRGLLPRTAVRLAAGPGPRLRQRRRRPGRLPAVLRGCHADAGGSHLPARRTRPPGTGQPTPPKEQPCEPQSRLRHRRGGR